MINYLKDFSIQRLSLFFNYSHKGFVLLTINEYHIMKEIEDFICTQKNAQIFDLSILEYNDILKKINCTPEIQVAVFSNFYMDINKAHIFLEKFNLGRDLLLSKIPYCVFIVPMHLELYIQESLPNLYSYFLLKERYIRKHSCCFKYILPEDMYLKTKDMQKNLKINPNDTQNNILQRLDGYLHVKVNSNILHQLMDDVSSYSSKLTNTEIDQLYACKLQISLAHVAIAQNDFSLALNIYKKLTTSSEYKQSTLPQALRLEIDNGMADTYLYMEKYQSAYDWYSQLLNSLTWIDDMDEATLNDFKIRLYSKIALCQIKLGNYTRTLQFIDQTLRHMETSDENYFHVYYNYFLMYLEMYSDRTIKSDKMLDALKNYPKNEVQTAMFLTVNAWYTGIILGNVYDAINIAHEALIIKRQQYIENDSRIAESHYVNALLRFFAGLDNDALHCIIKSQNILKNFKLYTLQKEQSQALFNEILEML